MSKGLAHNQVREALDQGPEDGRFKAAVSVEAANRRLQEAQEGYYAGRSVMSDAEYDTLEAELAGLIHAHPEQAAKAPVLNKVGSGPGAGRIPHAWPMRSIENCYTVEEMVRFFRKVGGPCSLSTKWDGVSASLIYLDGQLVEALTRGDGDAGESILAQVQASPSIPNSIPVAGAVTIRGELMVGASTMAAMNYQLESRGAKPYMSTRNLAAGTIKLGDAAEVRRRRLAFAAWDVLGDPFFEQAAQGIALPYLSGTRLDPCDLDSVSQALKLLDQFGFMPTDDTRVEGEDDLLAELERRIDDLGHPGEYGRDGVVLKADSRAARARMGVGSKFANYQVCFKPQNAKSVSVLREVQWQVGRLGRLTPVGVIDPVVLAGAVIERVTLNNLSWIREMKLEIGSRVAIVRSGDVIPKIVEVVD